ncbi:lipoprotein [gut metagenome]|uniref:Lipoprotein n=1 Tax=gut metagenome TaxID=749906 RepID=J9CSG1_9ZZZZ
MEKKRKKGDADTIQTVFLPIDVYAPSSMDVYDYLTFTFKEPLSRIDTASIHLRQKVDTLWEDRVFTLQRDSLDHKIYNLYPVEDWLFDGTYALDVDSMAFQGLYGLFTDKLRKEFKVKKQEDYGAIFFDVSGVDSTAFVELLDAQEKVLRTVPVVDGKADFYFLSPGKYGARLVNDRNGNGVWDTGNYSVKLQPEEVYYYWQVLELKANFELTQTWDIQDRSLDKQKPDELKKQKPDEDKKKRRNEREKNRNNASGSRNSGRGYSY